jgi:hypothetical protein
MPGYRGIANLMFRGTGAGEQTYVPIGSAAALAAGSVAGAFMAGQLANLNLGSNSPGAGFKWSTNNPFLPGCWINLTRMPKGLNPALAAIPNPQLDEEGVASFGDDCNGAHIVYECLTNIDWGMGDSSSSLDVPSFEDAAQTLFNENFGLSLQWVKPSTIESFVQEILDHIQGTLYQNPATGKLTLRLYRDDYQAVLATLPTLDSTNSKVEKFSRKAWGETVNEIVVSWTNPANEQEETVTYHDHANIAIQNGAIVSDSRNYYGVRNSDLAIKLAVRDIRTAAAPLASAEVTVDRRSFNLFPGGIVKLQSPKDNIRGS